MANPFIHVELDTTDLPKAREFYGKLFDWKLTTDASNQTYTMVEVGKGTGGGMMKHPQPGAPSMWLPYVEVGDVASVTRRARELGGTIAKDKTEVPGIGWFALLVDPTGAMLGLLEPKTR